MLSFIAADGLRHSVNEFFDYLVNNTPYPYPEACGMYCLVNFEWLPRSDGAAKHREDLVGQLERRLPAVLGDTRMQMVITKIGKIEVKPDVRPFGWSDEPITCLTCAACLT